MSYTNDASGIFTNLYSVLQCPYMTNQTIEESTARRVVQFRSRNADAQMIEYFDKQIELLEVTDSELARRAFALGLVQACKELQKEKAAEARQLLKKMERAKGFEPSTFTLATCAAGLKIIVRAGSIARNVVAKVRVGGALSDSPEHRGNKNAESAGAAANWGLRKRLNLAVR